MKAAITGIGGYVSDEIRTIDELVSRNPSWDASKLRQATGISTRRVAPDGWSTSDIAVAAARDLFERGYGKPSDVDALVVVNQIPDYFMPATSCIVQEKLGLPVACAAFDMTHGCSGFIYGLWLANSLVVSGAAKNVLLITADILSRYVNPRDRTLAGLFGDGGGAVLVSEALDDSYGEIGPFKLFTDGRGANHLIIPGGCGRRPSNIKASVMNLFDESEDLDGNRRAPIDMYMDGAEVFRFAVTTVTDGIRDMLKTNSLNVSDVDHFLLHQANGRIVDYMARRLDLPKEKVPQYLEDLGNTSQASLPLLVRHCLDKDTIKPGQRSLLAGFGVGLSWGFGIVKWGKCITK